MKNLTLIAALMLGTTTIASAETKTINGCEVVKAENGNYYNRVDPTCSLGSAFDGGNNTSSKIAEYVASQRPAVDPDDEPTDPKS